MTLSGFVGVSLIPQSRIDNFLFKSCRDIRTHSSRLVRRRKVEFIVSQTSDDNWKVPEKGAAEYLMKWVHMASLKTVCIYSDLLDQCGKSVGCIVCAFV